MKFRILIVAVLFFTALMAQAAVVTVHMTFNSEFSPETVTIAVGDTVTWVNDDFEPHTSTSTTGLWDTRDVDEDEAVSFTFTAPGSYRYRCIYHSNPAGTSGMIGTVIVTGAPNNVPPSVSLTTPADGAVFAVGAVVSLSADATDSDGTVAGVEFFAGTTLLGTDDLAPYSLLASNLATGSYTLTAQAIDNLGARATSGLVNITLVVPAELRLSSMTRSDSTFSVTLSTSPGLTYVLQKSTDLPGGWNSIQTNTAAGDSTILLDPSATNSRGFYRAYIQP